MTDSRSPTDVPRRIGAPKGSRNAWKHGAYSAPQIEQRRRVSEFIRACMQTPRELEEN